MNRYVERGWRPLLGALAIGLAAFGLSLQGAPAGDGTDLLVARGAESVDAAAASSSNKNAVSVGIPQAERQRKAAPNPGPSQVGTEPTAVNLTSEDAVMHARSPRCRPLRTPGCRQGRAPRA